MLQTQTDHDLIHGTKKLLAERHRWGITRVGDITGLDWLEIPVATAFRPQGRTLSVAQGKGPTAARARAAAIMEAIEFSAAEGATADVLDTPARDFHLPYPLHSLLPAGNTLITPATPLDWVHGHMVLGGDQVPVPLGRVKISAELPAHWSPYFPADSTGVAAGFDLGWATAHALTEVAERDCLMQSGSRDRTRHLDLSTVRDDWSTAFIDLVSAHDGQLNVEQLRSDTTGIFCFRATLWSEDFPCLATGVAAGLSPTEALRGALAEAAQSRLTAIAGVRDDLPDIYGPMRTGRSDRPVRIDRGFDWTEIGPSECTDDADIEFLASAITRQTAYEPLLVVLLNDPDVVVVRVVAPGMSS